MRADPCPNHPDRLQFGDHGVCLTCVRSNLAASDALEQRAQREADRLAELDPADVVKFARKAKVKVKATSTTADLIEQLTGARPSEPSEPADAGAADTPGEPSKG